MMSGAETGGQETLHKKKSTARFLKNFQKKARNPLEGISEQQQSRFSTMFSTNLLKANQQKTSNGRDISKFVGQAIGYGGATVPSTAVGQCQGV